MAFLKKNLLALLLALTVCTGAKAKKDLMAIADSIEHEGKLLYRSEWASWLGTDIFMERFSEKREDIGGYFSYTQGKQAHCIFFSKSDAPRILADITFDSSYSPRTTQIDTSRKTFTEKETALLTIRQKALATIQGDTFFKQYNNTNLNLIPFIRQGQKKVYVLTGTTKSNIMIFGNDYLLTYSDDNRLQSKEMLHRNILITPTKSEDSSGKPVIGALHNHISPTSPFITPTDICTLMLYNSFAAWKSYTVVSEKYISIWSCTKNKLIIITSDALNRINDDQEKRH